MFGFNSIDDINKDDEESEGTENYSNLYDINSE